MTVNAKKPSLLKVEDADTHRNFNELSKHLQQMSPIVDGKVTESVNLIVGDNDIPLPDGFRPQHRLTLYQSAASSLFDKGLTTAGRWRVNASVACACRFLFF